MASLKVLLPGKPPGAMFLNPWAFVAFVGTGLSVSAIAVSQAYIVGDNMRALQFARRVVVGLVVIVGLSPCLMFRARLYSVCILAIVVLRSWFEFLAVTSGAKEAKASKERGSRPSASVSSEKDANNKTETKQRDAIAHHGPQTGALSPLSPSAISAQLVFFGLPFGWLISALASGFTFTFARGPRLPLTGIQDIFCVVLCSDLLQYLGGRVLGLGRVTTKPFPRLSPNKSLGGYCFSTAVSILANTYLYGHTKGASAFFCGLGFAGDLAASLIKRRESQLCCEE